MFSFSGIKTASLYKIQELRKRYKNEVEWSCDFCREFISAISRSLTSKLERALKLHPNTKAIFVGGGVINNHYIVRDIGLLARKHRKKYLVPETRFRSDNGAMIGIVAYYKIMRKARWFEGKAILEIDRSPMLRLGDSRESVEAKDILEP
jgi:N6-L-threonylcarbamoyladenine synthase